MGLEAPTAGPAALRCEAFPSWSESAGGVTAAGKGNESVALMLEHLLLWRSAKSQEGVPWIAETVTGSVAVEGF